MDTTTDKLCIAGKNILQPANRARNKKIRIFITGAAFALPFLLVFVTFFFIPFFNGIRVSLLDKSGNLVWFANYKNILTNGTLIYKEEFFRGLKNTLIFVCISVPTLIIIPLFIAVLLDFEPPGYKLFRAILFMPTIFSISAVVLMWKRVFEVETGFINAIFLSMNLNQIDFLGSQPWAWVSILIVTVWWTMGTNIVILGAGLKNIDKTVYEAAAVDGASAIRVVFSITLPLLLNQILVVLVMTVLASFNIYGQPLLLTGGGPARSTQVLLMIIVRYLNDKPYIAAAMSLMLGLIMIAISLLQASFIRLKERKK